MYTLLTNFNQTYWEEVACTNMTLLDERWPRDQDIYLYYDSMNLKSIPERKTFSSRMQWIDFYEQCPEYIEFAETWKNDPRANGRGGNDFKFNAIKFAHKTFAIWHRAKQTPKGWLIWLDCDITTINQVDVPFLSTVCLDNFMVTYVGRPSRYSECGFMAFNMNHPRIHKFMQEWEELYTSGKFIEHEQTHDSWLFDLMRKSWDLWLFFDLNTVMASDSNPIGHSMLRYHFAHQKGDNKAEQQRRLLLKRMKQPIRPL